VSEKYLLCGEHKEQTPPCAAPELWNRVQDMRFTAVHQSNKFVSGENWISTGICDKVGNSNTKVLEKGGIDICFLRYGFRTFFTKIGLLKSMFLETVRAPIIISHAALFIPFHISHQTVKMPFTLYVTPIISSTTPDRNAFRSHVAGLP
jgi:hypothetical protein